MFSAALYVLCVKILSDTLVIRFKREYPRSTVYPRALRNCTRQDMQISGFERPIFDRRVLLGFPRMSVFICIPRTIHRIKGMSPDESETPLAARSSSDM